MTRRHLPFGPIDQLKHQAKDLLHEYRDVTPLVWGERFHDQAWVNRAMMEEIAARGGRA